MYFYNDCKTYRNRKGNTIGPTGKVVREDRIACGHLLLGTIMTESGTGYEVGREHIIRHGCTTRDWMGMSAGANGSTFEDMILGCWANSRVRQ